MLKAVYDAVWYPALPLVLWATAGRDREARRQRLGRVDPALGRYDGRPRIWMHAASVGEVEGLSAVAAGLLKELPQAALFVTVMTAPGLNVARDRIPGARAHLLAPLDCKPCVRSFLAAIKPALLVVTETELWPNYMIEADRSGARVAILNGRISDRSLRHYLLARALFAATLRAVSLIMAQSRADAERFAALGAPRDRIVVTGNTKFEPDGFNATRALSPELERFARGHKLFVAGSTAPGEDRIVVDAFLAMRRRLPELVMVLAPRHPKRISEVEHLLCRRSLSYLKASALGTVREAPAVLLLDTIGELRGLYHRAAVAFVGGSLVAGRGGHNLAEPAAAGVPVLFGPFHENQSQLAAALIETGGGKVVKNSGELARAVLELLEDEQLRERCGRDANAALQGLSGAVRTSLLRLRSLTNLT